MRLKAILGGTGLLSLIPTVSASTIIAAPPEAGTAIVCPALVPGWFQVAFPVACILLLGGVAVLVRSRDRKVGSALIPAATMAGMVVWGIASGLITGWAVPVVVTAGLGVLGYTVSTLPGSESVLRRGGSGI